MMALAAKREHVPVSLTANKTRHTLTVQFNTAQREHTLSLEAKEFKLYTAT